MFVRYCECEARVMGLIWLFLVWLFIPSLEKNYGAEARGDIGNNGANVNMIYPKC